MAVRQIISSSKIRRKFILLKTVISCKLKGYPYYIGKRWGKRINYDCSHYKEITKKEKKWAHNRGYLSFNVKKRRITEDNFKKYITDFEFTCLKPINNAYSKWLTDRLTPRMILQNYKELMPKLYCNIISREQKKIIIPIDREEITVDSIDSIVSLLKEKKSLLLLPSNSKTKQNRFKLSFVENIIYVNDKKMSCDELTTLIMSLKSYYVVMEDISNSREISEMFGGVETQITSIVSLSANNIASILCSYVEAEEPFDKNDGAPQQIMIDKDHGFFNGMIDGMECLGRIPDWQNIKVKICEIAEYMSEIEYFSIKIKISEEGIKIIGFDHIPELPFCASYDSEINIYLKEKALEKMEKIKEFKKPLKKSIKRGVLIFLKRHCFKRGFREYMLATWLNTVKDDFLHTKTTTLRQKIWAWKRGFPSYRISQYGLTEENYKNILSDYKYAWVNRINNTYQKWINDKLTLRYILDSEKKYLAEYYFYVGKRDNKLHLKKLQDCPDNISEDIQGIWKLLNEKKRLVFKPNAGTHGDGFYKFELKENVFYINDEEHRSEDFESIISGQKSTYVVTDYLEMHEHLKKIYAGSVNTIRIMVINNTCLDPQIVQTYMRVGTSKTGVTDNIAYGGIAVYVDKETGYYDRAGLLKDHEYQPIDRHPDTGTELKGYLPNWDIIKKGVIEIASLMPQLEYLGFDTVITKEGFKILEINIHQDIHKAHEFDDNINEFFERKIRDKERRNRKRGA